MCVCVCVCGGGGGGGRARATVDVCGRFFSKFIFLSLRVLAHHNVVMQFLSFFNYCVVVLIHYLFPCRIVSQ